MIGLKNGAVLDQYKFTVSKWRKEKNKIIEKIINKFKNNKIVIRSSCLEEDQRGNSSAGKFESQLSVDCNLYSIEKSVSKVIESYGDKNKDENQVFVQKFLNNVQFSGVAFSRMIEGNGPYFSINISYLDTTQVTAGNSCHEYFINRENLDLVKDNNIKKVILCLIEIENLLNFQLIDMEFALVENKISYQINH